VDAADDASCWMGRDAAARLSQLAMLNALKNSGAIATRRDLCWGSACLTAKSTCALHRTAQNVRPRSAETLPAAHEGGGVK